MQSRHTRNPISFLIFFIVTIVIPHTARSSAFSDRLKLLFDRFPLAVLRCGTELMGQILRLYALQNLNTRRIRPWLVLVDSQDMGVIPGELIVVSQWEILRQFANRLMTICPADGLMEVQPKYRFG